jgi:hypothetical protein
MTKKDFIALADAISAHNHKGTALSQPFAPSQIATLIKFCHSMNPNFSAGRWLDYLHGKCGPNGGAK